MKKTQASKPRPLTPTERRTVAGGPGVNNGGDE